MTSHDTLNKTFGPLGELRAFEPRIGTFGGGFANYIR